MIFDLVGKVYTSKIENQTFFAMKHNYHSQCLKKSLHDYCNKIGEVIL